MQYAFICKCKNCGIKFNGQRTWETVSDSCEALTAQQKVQKIAPIMHMCYEGTVGAVDIVGVTICGIPPAK